MKAETRVVALFGQPVGHSLSPAIFNTVFEKLGENRRYVPFDVREADLNRAVEAARTLNFEGFNVTMPYKTSIVEFLDGLDETAKEIRAVNTVSPTDKGLIGHNTDGEGAELAIRSYKISPRDQRTLIIGAGGSARAIVHRLAKTGTRLRILNREIDKARLVAEELGNGNTSFEKLASKTLEDRLRETDLLINATPIQTLAMLEQFGISFRSLDKVCWVFDLAYDTPALNLPFHTRRISALEMLLQQAGLSYKIWLKKNAPLDLMRSALVDHLGEDWR